MKIVSKTVETWRVCERLQRYTEASGTQRRRTEEQQTSGRIGRIMRKSATSSRAAANGSRGLPRVLGERALRPIPAARLSRGKLESSREPSNHERLAPLLRCRRRRRWRGKKEQEFTNKTTPKWRRSVERSRNCDHAKLGYFERSRAARGPPRHVLNFISNGFATN